MLNHKQSTTNHKPIKRGQDPNPVLLLMDWKDTIKNLLGMNKEPPKTIRVGDLNEYATKPPKPKAIETWQESPP